ncbi:MAG: tRNA pseudouridine(38-40) synthase TruA [Alistipes sp.]|jgi:tRNA pseudouridine38-40 synthase|nr:tRNA pseudouridine(38-40) synthase TruA [Alistipes sp.]
MRYFLELSYNGTAYRGWQRQRDVPSVQQTLEEALSRLLGAPTEVVGAGRTDTGVHAAHYVAHFDTEVEITGADGDGAGCRAAGAGRADGAGGDGVFAGDDFLYHANSMLPPDIALKSIRRVADDAHARYDATEREYTYYIARAKDPFRAGTAWLYTVPLDVDAMNRAAAYLLTVSDFTTFAKLGGGNKTNICRVTAAQWRSERGLRVTGGGGEGSGSKTPDGDSGGEGSSDKTSGGNNDSGGEQTLGCLTFTIRADRFLRNMVRAVVGTLVDVGRGKITPEQFAEIVDARNLSRASGGAPAHGLFLTGIKYEIH